MSDTVHETLYKRIDFEVDIEARRAKVAIPGILEAIGYPITAPHGDEEHRVRIDIPGGIEFELAEIGKATTKTSGGAIALDLGGSYGQFNILRHSRTGVVR